MTTAVFFALDGTLLTRTEPVETTVATVLQEELGKGDDALVDVYMQAAAAATPALETDPRVAGMEAVAAEVEGDADPVALADAVAAAELAATAVPEGATSALESLAADGHVGVITDGDRERQRAKIAAHDLPVETVVTAAEAGGPKVDGAPYDLARERVDAAEYVMVGDDYAADVEAARAAGFVPIHYETDGPSLWRTLNALV